MDLGGENKVGFVKAVDLVDPNGEAGLSKCPSRFPPCKAVRANYHKRMPAKTMCALVALLSCFSVIAADKKLSPEKRQALEVRRILGEYCGQCHGTGGARANKMLIDYDDLIERKHVVPKNPEDSKLYTRIKDAEMPPSESSNPVPVGELAVIKKWIEDGAVEWPPPPPPPNDPITHQQIDPC